MNSKTSNKEKEGRKLENKKIRFKSKGRKNEDQAINLKKENKG